MEKIHQQKCEVTDDINPPQRRIELQAIEKDRPALDSNEITQMKVTMAFPNPTLFPACREMFE
jgi:hypothetical protein